MNVAAVIVRLLHVFFVGFMIYAPFSSNPAFVLLASFVYPFLFLHWLTNSDACFLTIVEKRLRGLDTDSDSFINSIVAPIYVLEETSMKKVVWIVSLCLWGVSVYRLVINPSFMNELRNI
jgi:hypothetical protein